MTGTWPLTGLQAVSVGLPRTAGLWPAALRQLSRLAAHLHAASISLSIPVTSASGRSMLLNHVTDLSLQTGCGTWLAWHGLRVSAAPLQRRHGRTAPRWLCHQACRTACRWARLQAAAARIAAGRRRLVVPRSALELFVCGVTVARGTAAAGGSGGRGRARPGGHGAAAGRAAGHCGGHRPRPVPPLPIYCPRDCVLKITDSQTSNDHRRLTQFRHNQVLL